MNKLLIIILILVSIGLNSQTQSELLEKAYQKKSTKLANEFFENWRKEVPQISLDEFTSLNDTLKKVYQVFNGFYKPIKIDSFLYPHEPNDVFLYFPYLVIDDKIEIYITNKIQFTEQEVDSYVILKINRTVKNDTIKKQMLAQTGQNLSVGIIELFGPDQSVFYRTKDSLIYSIIDFRPYINYNNKTPLFLNPKYDSIFNSFLKVDEFSKKLGVLKYHRLFRQSKRRKEFLAKYIIIMRTYNLEYPKLLSYPIATSITFDEGFKYARVNFSLKYCGGGAVLFNNNGTWKLISAKLTWVY